MSEAEERVGLALHGLHQSISDVRQAFRNHPADMILEETWLTQMSKDLIDFVWEVRNWPPAQETGDHHKENRHSGKEPPANRISKSAIAAAHDKSQQGS